MTTQLLVLSNARPGAERTYLDWYRSRHLPDMLEIPGIAGGAVHTLPDQDGDARWGVAALYELTLPVSDVLAELFERAGGEAMPLTDAIDSKSVLMLAADPLGPRRLARGVIDRGDAMRYVVLSNPTAGNDEAFDAWYDDEHIPDVLAVPGFVAAQRFRLADETAGKPSPWRYLALYEIAPEGADASLAELKARAASGAMKLSATLDTSTVYARLLACVRDLPA